MSEEKRYTITATGAEITLIKPIKVKGQETSTITMRRPVLRDMRAARNAHPKDDVAQEIHLYASLTGIAPSELDDIDWADYKLLGEVHESFLSSGKTNGELPA